MRLKYRAIARAARKISDQSYNGISAATFLRENAQAIADRANADMDDAIASTSYGSRSSDPATPTEAKAMRGGDQVTRVAHALAHALVEADRHSRRAELELQNAERAGRWLLAMDAEKASNEAAEYARRREVADTEDDETEGSRCKNPNCRQYVARTKNDRLRGGRCNPCRVYLDRNGIERPGHLCALGDDVLGTDALGLDVDRLIVVDGAA